MKVKVTGSNITIVKDELLVDGSLNAYVIEFLFDKSWRELVNKTCVFYQPSVNPDNPQMMIISDDSKVIIPSGMLVSNDFLYIGVFGFSANGHVRLPTVFTYTFVKAGCYKFDGTACVPNSAYEQIYLMATKAVAIAMDARKYAEDHPGYSPTVTVKELTATSYILTITDINGSYDTPNLMGAGGFDPHDIYLTKNDAAKLYASKDEVKSLSESVASLSEDMSHIKEDLSQDFITQTELDNRLSYVKF